MEKDADALRRSGDQFMEFLDRIERWTSKHAKKSAELFRQFDQSGEGVVTHDEFKAGNHESKNLNNLVCLCINTECTPKSALLLKCGASTAVPQL